MLRRFSRLSIMFSLIICCGALEAASMGTFDHPNTDQPGRHVDQSETTKKPRVPMAILAEERRSEGLYDASDLEVPASALSSETPQLVGIIFFSVVDVGFIASHAYTQLSSVQQRGPPIALA